jgi:small subunit ribosomal protein S13
MHLFRQTNLPETEIRSSIKNVYGIGWLKACLITTKLGIPNPFPFSFLNDFQLAFILVLLSYYAWLDTKIRKVEATNIFIAIDTNSYRGIRHSDNLPCHGQRSRTNGRTKKKK